MCVCVNPFLRKKGCLFLLATQNTHDAIFGIQDLHPSLEGSKKKKHSLPIKGSDGNDSRVGTYFEKIESLDSCFLCIKNTSNFNKLIS